MAWYLCLTVACLMCAGLFRRGEEGSVASVRVSRQGREIDFVTHRQPLAVHSVTAARRLRAGERELGYVRLRSFSVASAPELSRAISTLQR
jgi:C-terminal processing protease CtpA/Prc